MEELKTENEYKEHIKNIKSVQSPHFVEESVRIRLPKSDWELVGHSQAAERTMFWIPQLQIFLDGGMNSYRRVSHILLTHSHADHTQNIPSIAMGPLPLHERPIICMPPEVVKPLTMLTRYSQALNDCRDILEDEGDVIRYIGVSAGETYPLIDCKGGNLEVRVVQCFHTVPCLGYVIFEQKKKLKEEYKWMVEEKKGRELGELRKKGVEVEEKIKVPKLCFLGDTNIKVFEENKWLFEVPIIIVECTCFGEDVTPEDAYQRGHCHWKQLYGYVKENAQTMFILIHFSRRYNDQQIAHYFITNGKLPNLIIWLDSGPLFLKNYI